MDLLYFNFLSNIEMYNNPRIALSLKIKLRFGVILAIVILFFPYIRAQTFKARKFM